MWRTLILVPFHLLVLHDPWGPVVPGGPAKSDKSNVTPKSMNQKWASYYSKHCNPCNHLISSNSRFPLLTHSTRSSLKRAVAISDIWFRNIRLHSILWWKWMISLLVHFTTCPIVPLDPFCPTKPGGPVFPTDPVSPSWPWWPLAPYICKSQVIVRLECFCRWILCLHMMLWDKRFRIHLCT